MMRTKRVSWLLLALLLGCAAPASAQFYTMGEDPGGLRWSSVETPSYRVIYPRGLDSLGRAYATALERWAGPVAGSIGIRPNAAYANKMPVVLHTRTVLANGQVTWTPRRLELLTVPEAFAPEPTPWITQLAVHESRHVAQMQAGAARPFRWLGVLTGQLGAGALAAVYGGPAFLEGDAVAAETALTASGRGRTADFLEYYRVSFADGDYRDFWRWRYGSQRRYTPDYYRAGYLAVGGIRAHYGVPDLTARFYRRIADHGGFAFSNWDKTIREATGKSFREAFAEVSHALQEQWTADEAARGPFQPSEAVSAVPRRYLEYTSLTGVGEDLYAVRGGLTQPDRLVRIAPDGAEQPLTLLGAGLSRPRYSIPAGRLYWSETVRDPRWTLQSWSVIRSSDGRSARLLTRRTRYFHPAPAPDAALLSVTEYREDGTSRVVVLDAEDGSVRQAFPAPDGLQVVETAWIGDELYASGITEEGSGLWRVRDFRPVLAPRPVKIKQLWSREGQLLFTCDLTGVNELYALRPEDGRAERLTTTRFGASDFEVLRDTLFYAALQPEGRLVRKTALGDLRPQPADFSVLPRYPFAEELAAGEPAPAGEDEPVEVGDPQPYGKLAHLFRFHSWAPLYVKYDAVGDLSFETLQQSAGLGATAFWQNDLGSGYGTFGYHAAPVGGRWRHSGHATFTYTGLYPVIEAGLDVGDRQALHYHLERSEAKKTVSLKGTPRDAPSVSGYLRAYIPWSFSSGGWQRGLVPSVKLLLNNDIFDEGFSMNRTTASLRGYLVQRTPPSRLYPRFGIGAEAGYSFRWTRGLIAPAAYGYLYGYLPGLWETHGLRWSAMYARRFNDGLFSESYASTAPRGFDPEVIRQLSAFPSQFRGSLDYKLPFIPVDRALLGSAAYLRNFEITLHGDWSVFSDPARSGSLSSIGADFAAVLGNLFWIPYRTRIGVSYDYNGGASFESFAVQGLAERHRVSLLFSIEM